VRFEQGTRALVEHGTTAFVECSPHPVLQIALEDTTAGAAAVVCSLRRGDGGPRRFLMSLADAHARGVAIAWDTVLPAAQRAELPSYAFQRRRHWVGEEPREPAAALPLRHDAELLDVVRTH